MLSLIDPTLSTGKEMPRLKCAPFFTVRGLVSVLGRSENDIEELIRSKKLEWIFDIGLGRRNRELRVLAASVVLFLAGATCRITWEEIATSLVPEMTAARPGVVVTIPAIEIQRILNACQTHVAELCSTGQLKIVVKGRSGPGKSPKICAQSFLNFLHKRKLH